MTRRSAIPPATLRAYQQTEYQVLGPQPAVLRIGAACPELMLLHARYEVRCSAFITAWNPHGLRADDADNAIHQEALLAELSRLKLVTIPGIGQHPTNDWPGEPSFLVPGLQRPLAQQLARQFEQNALVWSGLDAVPELILLG